MEDNEFEDDRCPYCGEDLIEEYSEEYEEDSKEEHVVVCPHCGYGRKIQDGTIYRPMDVDNDEDEEYEEGEVPYEDDVEHDPSLRGIEWGGLPGPDDETPTEKAGRLAAENSENFPDQKNRIPESRKPIQAKPSVPKSSEIRVGEVSSNHSDLYWGLAILIIIVLIAIFRSC